MVLTKASTFLIQIVFVCLSHSTADYIKMEEYLRTAVEQLQKKKEIINQIDQQIAELVQMPEELEEAVCEAESSRTVF